MILQSLKEKLEVIPGLCVSERGTGKAKFLYVRSLNRSIEVYEENSGVFIECWDSADEDADDASVKREIVKSETEALTTITDWLWTSPK